MLDIYRGQNDLCWTDIVTHAIDTGDSKPVRQLLTRHPSAHKDAIQKNVSDMSGQGVIEPALGVECCVGEKERWFAHILHRLS